MTSLRNLDDDANYFQQLEIDRLRAEIKKLRKALVAFADHFGPLEDNHLLHEEARRCFRLAREALAGGKG